MFRAVKAASRTFRPEPGQIAAARQFAHAVLDEWGFVSDDAVLVVSELATNATVHAQSTFSVSLQGDAQQLLVEVADASPALPTVLDTPATALHGRGLAIVARVWPARGGRGRRTRRARLSGPSSTATCRRPHDRATATSG